MPDGEHVTVCVYQGGQVALPAPPPRPGKEATAYDMTAWIVTKDGQKTLIWAAPAAHARKYGLTPEETAKVPDFVPKR